jgi:hypothetical protein
LCRVIILGTLSRRAASSRRNLAELEAMAKGESEGGSPACFWPLEEFRLRPSIRHAKFGQSKNFNQIKPN